MADCDLGRITAKSRCENKPIFRHGSKAGYSSGVAGVDARRATPPDSRPPRWGLAGCCQLDPSHPTIVTCAVGRAGRHAPRPNDVGGQPRFPGARTGGDPAAAGDLRLGHAWRRASIPLHVLTTLWSALGAFCLLEPRGARIWPGNLRNICSDICRCEFRESQQISTFYEPSVQAMETRLGARQRRRPPTVHRGRTHAPRPQRPVASENEASACSELRLGCHPETPVIELCQTKPNSSGVSHWQIVTWDELPRNHAAKTNPIFDRRQRAWPGREIRGWWPVKTQWRVKTRDHVCLRVPATLTPLPMIRL